MRRLNDSRMISIVGHAFGVSAATAMRSTVHQQHGVALFVGIEADVTIREAAGGSVAGRVVIVPADVAHTVESPGPAVAMLYDPDELPRVAGYARGGGTRLLRDRISSRLMQSVIACRASLGRHDVLEGLGRELVGMLREAPATRLDPRVRRALEVLRDPEVERAQLLRAAGLSEAHLEHLFARDVGLTMRRFRLWQRLLAAVLRLRHVDATSAAHAAGFADLAHFSRTCRAMLGHSPTEMRAGLATDARGTL